MLLFLSGVFSKFGGLSITFTIDSRSSSLSNWWENRVTLFITWKVLEADLILSGSSISSSTSSSFDTSITSSAGFHVIQWFLFEFLDARKCCPHLLLASRKQYPCQNPRNHLGQRHQQVPHFLQFVTREFLIFILV